VLIDLIEDLSEEEERIFVEAILDARPKRGRIVIDTGVFGAQLTHRTWPGVCLVHGELRVASTTTSHFAVSAVAEP
jgi:hypothetical protein